MDPVRITVLVAAACLGLLVLLQLALALGVPWGHLAWGGRQRRLPAGRRGASLFAALVLAGAVWLLLVRAGLLDGPSSALLVRVGARGLALFFALNALGNLASSSRAERWVMTPVAALLAIAFFLVSRG